MVVLDTNIIIDHLRQGNISLLKRITGQMSLDSLSISVITIQELYMGTSTKRTHNEEDMLNIISPLTVLQYSYQEANLAGIITRDSDSPIEFADAAIASTCILNNAELATLNIKHFKNIPDLKIFDFKLLEDNNEQ